MIIDRTLLDGGIKAGLMSKLILRYKAEADKFGRLRDYYEGRHAILNRQRKSKEAANTRIVLNHAKYITDMTTSYLIGNAVTYAASEEFDIEALKNAYLEQDIASTDSEIVKNVSIYGRAYELIYANENAAPESAVLPPDKAFVVYGDECRHDPILGVYFFKKRDLDGRVTGVECRAYDENNVYVFAGHSDSFDNMELIDTQAHHFGGVPMIEYCNNTEKQGDFEQLIPAMDAYNTLMSDRVNDKEQFVEAFLFLVDLDIDSETAQKLREEKILMGYEGAKAEYLSKVMQESDVEVLRNNLKDDIHRFSMVPDLSDESFGNNLSGVAIKYKLLGFEQSIMNKERKIAKGLKRRLELYINFLYIKGSMALVPTHRIDVVFTRNLPANELEISQMAMNLTDIVSNETLLEQLPFVTDAKEEMKILEKERESDSIMKIKEVQDMAAGGGY